MAPEPIVKRALKWLMSDDTGISSTALCAHMLGIEGVRNMPPSDAGDRGRCIRLLQLIPEWQPRLDEMAGYKGTESMVLSASGMNTETNAWADQIPLIRSEGGFTDYAS